MSSLLEMTPTDAEAWAELADLYLAQGLYSQAIFAEEEVLILQPNAWNVRHMYPGALDFAPGANIGLIDTCPSRRDTPHGSKDIRRP